jgi:hypothetical protein
MFGSSLPSARARKAVAVAIAKRFDRERGNGFDAERAFVGFGLLKPFSCADDSVG